MDTITSHASSRDLAAALDGKLSQRGEAGFDASRRLWNARFDRSPELIASCVSPGDVEAAIAFARDNRLQLSVKGGGHSFAGRSVAAGGLLIDLSPMNAVSVDVAGRTVRVGAGVTCGELDAATQQHGLATPAPTVSSVGVIGAALGGGSGYLSRRHGLMIDNVVGAEMVTADGRRLRISADENRDLFWAIRGGGGNFGVVTSLELRLHEVGPMVLSGQIIYPFEDARRHLRAYRDFMAGAPEELQCYAFFFRVPPIDAFPAEWHGRPVVDFVFCHQDPAATAVIRPLRELAKPILDLAAATPYVATQTAFDAGLPPGQRYLSKAHDLDELTDGAIDAILEHVPTMVGAFTVAYLDPQGGAIGRVPVDATAYAGRRTAYGFHVIAGWMAPDEDASVIGWASGFAGVMAQHATGGVYVNLIADDEANRVPNAYGPNYRRLRDLKRAWDPDNMFRSNHNVPPA